ncbi:hypothetical protein PsYK624_107730 [Phanerochaete sordida]|uniref:Uncharacterized protein n=1 Tax=Phanerochaete sordida TaxID=48140 RepID=A0A9P3LH61_9APHY|nr:hypothetical protein PsYK624_107730 [Phanerochaete sordida]
MTSNDSNVPHSQPIPINPRRGRADSVSDSSSSEDSNSPVSPSSSPISGMAPRVAPTSPGSTPILNYFLSQSPKSPSTSTFPFRRGFGTAVFEDDFDPDAAPKRGHARSVSSAAWPTTERVSPPSQPPVQPAHGDRAAGLLRRLSLGGTALRPPPPQIKTAIPMTPTDRVPPNTPAVERPSPPSPIPRKARRANTLAPGTARPKRAPSPMGERILTGHFDGFN